MSPQRCAIWQRPICALPMASKKSLCGKIGAVKAKVVEVFSEEEVLRAHGSLVPLKILKKILFAATFYRYAH